MNVSKHGEAGEESTYIYRCVCVCVCVWGGGGHINSSAIAQHLEDSKT
jgi:hypothetical protein